MYVLQSADIREAVIQKIQQDLQEFGQLHEIIDSEIESLFVDDDELRSIWRTRVQFGHEGDLLEWFGTLSEHLRLRAEHIGRSVVLPKEYLVTNEALECVTIVQRDIAKRWNQRLSQQLHDSATDDESTHLLGLLADVQQYLNYLHTPKRSSTYDDLHTRHMG
jgi:DNA primase